MKYLWKTWSLCLMITAWAWIAPRQTVAQPAVSISLQTFYDALSPHGTWVSSPEYGYVWVPQVGPDFRPYYTNGRWVMTEYGNTWVSDYSWGWAPFHYGRWTLDPYYGWIWIPGTEWGPAWVCWRQGGGYYGWAPLGPKVQIHLHLGSYNPPALWWVFIPNRHIYSPRFHSYYRGPSHNTTIIHHTTIINNTYVQNNHRYITGPRRQDIERETGKKVTVYQVRQNQRPGPNKVQRNALTVYKPEVVRPGNARPKEVVPARNAPREGIVRPSNTLRTDPNIRVAPQSGQAQSQPAAARPAPSANPKSQAAPSAHRAPSAIRTQPSRTRPAQTAPAQETKASRSPAPSAPQKTRAQTKQSSPAPRQATRPAPHSRTQTVAPAQKNANRSAAPGRPASGSQNQNTGKRSR